MPDDKNLLPASIDGAADCDRTKFSPISRRSNELRFTKSSSPVLLVEDKKLGEKPGGGGDLVSVGFGC